VDLRVCEPRLVATTFYIADESALLRQTGAGEAMVFTDRRRVRAAIARHTEAVAASLPGLQVAEVLQRQAELLLTRADSMGATKEERWWLSRRINFGRFARPRRGLDLATVERRLLAAGLLVREPDGSCFPRYDLDLAGVSRSPVASASDEARWCPRCWSSVSMCECGEH
jgi:hypothetical protein